jgi:hypothetical protein
MLRLASVPKGPTNTHASLHAYLHRHAHVGIYRYTYAYTRITTNTNIFKLRHTCYITCVMLFTLPVARMVSHRKRK